MVTPEDLRIVGLVSMLKSQPYINFRIKDKIELHCSSRSLLSKQEYDMEHSKHFKVTTQGRQSHTLDFTYIVLLPWHWQAGQFPLFSTSERGKAGDSFVAAYCEACTSEEYVLQHLQIKNNGKSLIQKTPSLWSKKTPTG